MSNELQKVNEDISEEITSSTELLTMVKKYHGNISDSSLARIEKQYGYLDRLFGGKLVRAATDQQLIQAKNEFDFINRAHELKINYTIDIIRNTCIANLTIGVGKLNKKVIVEIEGMLEDLQKIMKDRYYNQMKEYKIDYQRAKEFENDEKLYGDYVKFIDNCKERMGTMSLGLLAKFQADVDDIMKRYKPKTGA